MAHNFYMLGVLELPQSAFGTVMKSWKDMIKIRV